MWLPGMGGQRQNSLSVAGNFVSFSGWEKETSIVCHEQSGNSVILVNKTPREENPESQEKNTLVVNINHIN